MFQSADKGRFKIFSKNTSTINISTEINKINNLSPYNNEEKKNDSFFYFEDEIDSKEENLSINNNINEIFDNDIKGFKIEDLLENDKISLDDIFSINSKNDYNFNENYNMEKFLSLKRGNDEKRKRKKKHTKFEKDNIMRKVNSHFISFIVEYVNHNIKKLISKKHPLFTNLSYNFKKNINLSYFNKLKKMTLGEVLKNEVSSKNKNKFDYQKDSNDNIFKLVYPSLKSLLDINYIEFFNNVYLQLPMKSDDINKIYKAPKNILYFDDLIEREMERDKIEGQLYKERLKYIIRTEFIHKEYPFFNIKTKKQRRINIQK